MVDQYRCTYFYSPTNTRNSHNNSKYQNYNNNSYSSHPKFLAPPVRQSGSGVTCEQQPSYDDDDTRPYCQQQTSVSSSERLFPTTHNNGPDNSTYEATEESQNESKLNSKAETIKALEEESSEEPPVPPPPDNSQYLLEAEPDKIKSPVPENSDERGSSGQGLLKFIDESIRKGFQRKVFSLLFIQLLITCGIISLFIYQRDLKEWTRNHPSFLIGSIIVVFCLTILTICSEAAGKKSPRNLLLLASVTISYALLASTISVYFKFAAILYAVGLTATIPFILFAYSTQSKYALTFWTGIVIVLGAFLVYGTVGYFLIHRGIIPEVALRPLTFVLIAAFIMSCVLVFDITRMLKQTHAFEISPKDYVLGSLAIYVDVLIFVIIILVIWDWGEKQGGGECCMGPVNSLGGYPGHYYQGHGSGSGWYSAGARRHNPTAAAASKVIGVGPVSQPLIRAGANNEASQHERNDHIGSQSANLC